MKNFVVLLFLSISFTSFSQNIELYQFCLMWELESVQLNGEEIDMDVVDSYEFKKNGTFRTYDDGVIFNGDWKINKTDQAIELYAHGSDDLVAIAILKENRTLMIVPIMKTEANGKLKLQYILKPSNS